MVRVELERGPMVAGVEDQDVEPGEELAEQGWGSIKVHGYLGPSQWDEVT